MAVRHSEVEVLPGPDWPPPVDHSQLRRSRRRIATFVVVLVLSAAAGLSYVFSRPAIYQATASLLISAAPDVDEAPSEADLQHIAIQRQRLLSQSLLEATLDRLESMNGEPGLLTTGELRRAFGVESVSGTHVMELHARGAEPQLLADMVNAWTDAYLEARDREASSATDTTASALREQYTELAQKLETKRAELDAFRRNNDILTAERNENEILARLKGLNQSLAKARETEVTTKARLQAVEQAAARGEPVVPDKDKASLAAMERRAQDLREQLTDLNQRYTPEFLSLEPTLKIIPEQLRELEAKIEQQLNYGKRIVLSDARQDYATARKAVRQLEQQLADHRKQATEFTARFGEHEALQEDLARLEELFRVTEERMVKLEVRNQKRYPPVTVIEAAFPPSRPVWPHYERDAAIVMVSSVLLAILAVWLLDFLSRREGAPAGLTLAGVRVYAEGGAPPLGQDERHRSLEHQSPQAALTQLLGRELKEPEIRALWEAADPIAGQLLSLLLSGLDLSDILRLKAADFDLDQGRVRLRDDPRGSLLLTPAAIKLFRETSPLPAWINDDPSLEELRARLAVLAVDAGLREPDQIDDRAIRHTYISYLVRQGLRLSEVHRVAGPISPTVMAQYRELSPPGPGKGVDQISPVYPLPQPAAA